MDTTPEYILQCENAVEIQAIWQAALDSKIDLREFRGSILVGTENGWTNYKRVIYLLDDEIINKLRISPEVVWLPRQDQLQILSGLSWQEFDKECLRYNMPTKEQAGLKVVLKLLGRTFSTSEEMQ